MAKNNLSKKTDCEYLHNHCSDRAYFGLSEEGCNTEMCKGCLTYIVLQKVERGEMEYPTRTRGI